MCIGKGIFVFITVCFFSVLPFVHANDACLELYKNVQADFHKINGFSQNLFLRSMPIFPVLSYTGSLTDAQVANCQLRARWRSVGFTSNYITMNSATFSLPAAPANQFSVGSRTATVDVTFCGNNRVDVFPSQINYCEFIHGDPNCLSLSQSQCNANSQTCTWVPSSIVPVYSDCSIFSNQVQCSNAGCTWESSGGGGIAVSETTISSLAENVSDILFGKRTIQSKSAQDLFDFGGQCIGSYESGTATTPAYCTYRAGHRCNTILTQSTCDSSSSCNWVVPEYSEYCDGTNCRSDCLGCLSGHILEGNSCRLAKTCSNQGWNCGTDELGNSCGTCSAGNFCTSNNQCQQVPFPAGTLCGWSNDVRKVTCNGQDPQINSAPSGYVRTQLFASGRVDGQNWVYHLSSQTTTTTINNMICVCGDGLVTGDQVCDFGSGRNNNLIPSSNERYYSLPDGSLAYGVSRIDYFCDNCIASRNETVYPGGYCGDGVVQHPPEQCDGTLVNTNCQIIGSQYRGFSLGCFVPGHLNQCTYDSSSCLECSNDNFVRCSYEGDGYLLQEYNILQSSPFVCRFDTSDMQWSWRNHPEGLHRINETVVEACGTRFNGQLVDMNCNANQQFYYDGTSLNLRRYIGDSSGITFNVIPDIDAFDPHCFGSVRGEVVDSGEDLFEARVLLYIQDEQGNGQLFRETTTNLNGHFDFGEIPSTRYKIIVQKDGYFSAVRLINLNYNDIKDDLVFDLSQGACQSDCTLGDGFCRAECDGINGCEFLPNTKESFNLVQQGVFRFIGDSYYKTCNELITDPDLILTALASEDVTCVDGTSLFVERRIVLFNAEPAEVYIYICR